MLPNYRHADTVACDVYALTYWASLLSLPAPVAKHKRPSLDY
jgi:hypothetical protein